MKKLGFSVNRRGTTIEEAIGKAREWKLEALELNLNRPEYFPEQFDPKKRIAIKRRAEQSNIQLLLHAPDDINLLSRHKNIRLAGVERLKEMLDFGKELGGVYFTLHTGKVALVASGSGRVKIMQHPTFKPLAENFRDSALRLLEFADGKLELGFENTNHFEGFFEEIIAGLLEQSQLKLTWDIGHSFAESPEKVEQTLRFFFTYLPRVKAAHLHDRNGKTDHLPVGSGTIPWKRFGEVLQTGEIFKIVEVKDAEAVETSLAFLRKLSFDQTFTAPPVSKK
ncbi:MAG: sugar phosphate isomerase/epimerase [candidate division Zixibacteria bacterium]|nr:sugar phosphate isomerase/epimerase [candidate division Zixibacteria bacterium]MCI0595124.1 sugar phosphate isomerase/epimerase [candidate division Zixibacteria bacterium]